MGELHISSRLGWRHLRVGRMATLLLATIALVRLAHGQERLWAAIAGQGQPRDADAQEDPAAGLAAEWAASGYRHLFDWPGTVDEPVLQSWFAALPELVERGQPGLAAAVCLSLLGSRDGLPGADGPDPEDGDGRHGGSGPRLGGCGAGPGQVGPGAGEQSLGRQLTRRLAA